MLLFQVSPEKEASKPVSRLGSYVPVPTNDSFLESWKNAYITPGATFGSGVARMSISGTIPYKGASLSPTIYHEFDSKQWGWDLTADLNTRYGLAGYSYVSPFTSPESLGSSVGITLNNGLSAFYRFQRDGGIEITPTGERNAGGAYAIWDFQDKLHAGESPGITGYLGVFKAGLNAIYSIGTRIGEIFSHRVEEAAEPPTSEVLRKVRKGEGSIPECLQVLQYKGKENATEEENKQALDDRQKAGITLETLLLVDKHDRYNRLQPCELTKLAAGKDSYFDLAEWEKLVPILEKNREAVGTDGKTVALLSSDGFADIKGRVDEIRMAASGKETFKFIKNAQQSGGFVGGLMTGISAITGNLLNVEQISFGPPLKLRWHGWNIPMTLIHTAIGCFEDIGQFKNTREADSGFLGLGKAFGFVKDIVGDALSIPANIIGAVFPFYMRSDARMEDAKENVRNALGENRNIMARKRNDADDKKLYSNLLYLNAMLPVLMQTGEEGLGRKVMDHIKNKETEYELLSCKMLRVEAEKIAGDLASRKYDRNQGARQDAESLLVQRLYQLSESYAYISQVDDTKLATRISQEKMAVGMLFAAARENLYVREFVSGNSTPENAEYVDPCTRNEKLVILAKKFTDGEMTAEWKGIVGAVNEGKNYADLSDVQRQLLQDLSVYQRQYGSMQIYLSDWAAKQDRVAVSSAIALLAGRCAKNIDKMNAGKAKEQDANAVTLDMIMLNSITMLYPSQDRRDEYESLENALDGMTKKIAVKTDDLKKSNDRLAFIKNLAMCSTFIERAVGMDMPLVSKDNFNGWKKNYLSESFKTLYELKNEVDKSQKSWTVEETQAYQQLGQFMEQMYKWFGEDMLDKLSEKQKSAVKSMLTAKGIIPPQEKED